MKIFVIILFSITLVLSTFIYRVISARKQGNALLRIINLVTSNNELIEEIGEIQTTGVSFYSINLKLGKAELQMELIGAKMTKSIHVNGTKNSKNEWIIEITDK